MHRAGVSAVDVSVIGTERGHLELKTVLQDHDHAEMRADCVRSRKERLHRFGSRIGGDVVILRCQPAHHVAHTTASEVRDVALLTQLRRDFARRLFPWTRFSWINR